MGAVFSRLKTKQPALHYHLKENEMTQKKGYTDYEE